MLKNILISLLIICGVHYLFFFIKNKANKNNLQLSNYNYGANELFINKASNSENPFSCKLVNWLPNLLLLLYLKPYFSFASIKLVPTIGNIMKQLQN